MSTTSQPAPGAIPPAVSRLIRRRMIQLAVQVLAFCVILFLAAGTVRWPNAWAYAGLYLALIVANGLYVLPRNAEIAAERSRWHTGTCRFDRLLMGWNALAFLGILVVAGLDAGRFGWAPLGWPWALAGGVLLAASMVPVGAAMAVNRHLETTVRIQRERGHQVVTSGPYRWVRHPMYVGMLMQLPAMALLLGSAWALVPALASMVLTVIRTGLEDRTLLRDLPGYASYAQVTRYRLVPGIW